MDLQKKKRVGLDKVRRQSVNLQKEKKRKSKRKETVKEKEESKREKRQ